MKLLHVAPALAVLLRISNTFGLSFNPSIAAMNPKMVRSSTPPTSVDLIRNASVTRSGSSLMLNGEQWTTSGANVYWLGLDENVIPPPGQPFYPPLKASYPTFGRITEIMNTLQIMGARTICGHTLGISVGNPLSVMPELGVVNGRAFDTIDWAIYEVRKHGIRIFAPLVDNYDYYHGGKFTFLRWAGFNLTGSDSTNPEVMQFYTNQTIIDDFKNYIKVILTRTNQFTGLTYAEGPTIFAYETGNELGGPTFGDKWVPNEWTKQIASYIKELAPNMHDVPDCTIYVNHTDGETLQYGNPENTMQTNTQIFEIRQHLFRMQGQNVSLYLPPVPCPGN